MSCWQINCKSTNKFRNLKRHQMSYHGGRGGCSDKYIMLPGNGNWVLNIACVYIFQYYFEFIDSHPTKQIHIGSHQAIILFLSSPTPLKQPLTLFSDDMHLIHLGHSMMTYVHMSCHISFGSHACKCGLK